ncbi:class II aldolase [Jiella sp. CQZ9-1]|uniref:Class II aldolase n=2 Tax=Jiella flava TaxID=2816857 RepID=A0A939FWD7_9HYPH|nr:class II aldolase [Jiella flava]
MDALNLDDELATLKTLSAALGRDRLKTQAAGGNTSVKAGGLMWVKASGTWLAQAKERDIFVPVWIDPLLTALQAGDPRAEKATDFIASDLAETTLRPSIETTVHAAMGQAVALHIHCVETIALAVRADGEAAIREKLAAAGLEARFAFVPYRRPGVPLARAIQAVAAPQTDILVLQNHGLVVAGDSVAQAAEWLDQAIGALAVPPRSENPPADLAGLAALAEATPYRLPTDARAHQLARDAASRRVALAGPLYPDHVIFLGETIGAIAAEPAAMKRFLAATSEDDLSPLLVVGDRGVLMRKTLTASGEAMVGCLTDVAARIPADVPLKPLTGEEIYALTHWEAESYRQTLDTPSARGSVTS